MLAERVFGILADRLSTKEEFGLIVSSGSSFENWLNFEFYVACIDAGLTCAITPRYSALSCEYIKGYGDLLIEAGKNKLMIEAKIIGDCTLDKYIAAIEADRRALCALAERSGISGLQLVLLFSSEQGLLLSWEEWLKRISFWEHPSSSSYKIPLEYGEAILRGWHI